MISCIRRLQFCAGHRVYKHESKCSHLHGHNYVVFIHARADELDDLGRVIDFSILKERVGHWIDTNWDHGFLLCREDEQGQSALKLMGVNQRIYLMENPTVENMALHLLDKCAENLMLGTNVEVFRVVMWETENCFAEASL